MSDEECYKAINFDLDTNKLNEYFEYRSEAYNKIKNFMTKNGFEHRQYSGYKSLKPLTNGDMTVLIYELNNKFDWLKDCVNRFDVTNIGEQYDYVNLIKNNFLVDENIEKKQQKDELDISSKALDEIRNEMNARSDEKKQTKTKRWGNK